VNLPRGAYLEEVLQESDNGLRFFGAVRFELSELPRVYEVLTAERSACIAAMNQTAVPILSEVLHAGWALRNSTPPEEILSAICSRLGVVIGIYGEFDDPDVSVAAIGKMEAVNNFGP
jgi:hypothetical protein